MTTTQTRETITVDGARSPVAVDLSAIGAKPKATGKSKYPVHNDPTGDVAKLVPMIRKEQDDFDALEGNLKLHKAELTALTVPFYFETNNGRADVPSSVLCEGADEKGALGRALVTFETRFLKTNNSAPIVAAMGAERYAKFIRQGYTIKIDGSLIPPAVANALIPELVQLFAKHNATAALSKDEIITATPEFFAQRFATFTPEENQKINLALPIRTAVKTKNVK